jgi:hypothetical protein
MTVAGLWGALRQLETRSGCRIADADRVRYEQFLHSLDETALARGRTLDDAETWALALGDIVA